MKHFLKLAFSIIKRNLSLFIALTGVMVCAVALLSGMSSAYSNLNDQVYEYVDSCNYPSLTISTSLQRKKDSYITGLQSIRGVKKAAYRIQLDASCEHNTSSLYARITSYGGDNFVNYTIEDELETESKRNIAVDDRFASRANIKLGDTLKVGFIRFNLAFTVNRIVSSCESFSEKQSDVLPSGSDDFGFLYVEEDVLQQIGLGNYFNQVIIDTRANADLENIKSQIQSASLFSFDSIMTIDESPVYNNISYNLSPLRSAAIYFPIIFYVLGMIVTVLFIFLMVKSYQGEMGILLCLGFKKKDLFALFALIGFFAGIFASIFGLGGGYAIAVYGYKAFIPHFALTFRWPTFSVLGTSLSVIACLVVATISGAISSLLVIHKMSPVEAIAKPVENSSFKIKSKKIPLSIKVNLLRIFRNLRTNLFSIFCLSLSFAMIYTSFAFSYGRRVLVDDLFETRMNFSALIFFSSEEESDVDAAFKGDSNIIQYEVLDWAECTAKDGSNSSTGVFVGLDSDQTMLKIMGTNRNIISNPEDGAILDSHLAEDLNLGVGDYFELGDDSYQIEAISKQDSFRLNYLPKEIFLKSVTSYSLCTLVDCKDFSKLKTASSSYKNCVGVFSMSSMRSSLNSSISSTDTAMEIIIIICILSSIAITSNIKAAELLKERGRISLMRSMGYSLPSVSGSLLLTDVSKTLISLPIGYGIGAGVASFILGMMDTPNFSYPYVNAPILFFGTAGIIVGLEFVSHAFIHLRLSKMNLAFELKGKE